MSNYSHEKIVFLLYFFVNLSYIWDRFPLKETSYAPSPLPRGWIRTQRESAGRLRREGQLYHHEIGAQVNVEWKTASLQPPSPWQFVVLLVSFVTSRLGGREEHVDYIIFGVRQAVDFRFFFFFQTREIEESGYDRKRISGDFFTFPCLLENFFFLFISEVFNYVSLRSFYLRFSQNFLISFFLKLYTFVS